MSDSVEDEFNMIKDCVIYLDWNIMSYLSDPSKLGNDLKKKCICFDATLAQLIDRNRIAIPYSNGHFLDIRQGSPESTEAKLKVLAQISRGWRISEDQSDRSLLRLDKAGDILLDYREYVKQVAESEENSRQFAKLLDPIIYEKLRKDIREKADSLTDPINKRFAEDLVNYIRPPEEERFGVQLLKLNKRIKATRINFEGRFFKYPQASRDLADELDEDKIKEKVNACLERSDLPYKTYDEFFKSMFFLDIPILSSFQITIMKLCALADLIGITSEKADKKTSFQSIINDQVHLTYGLRCRFFVSEDKNLLVKANLAKKWMKLRVKVFHIDSFIQFVLHQMYLQNPETKDQKSEQLLYDFVDLDGNLIKSYIITV